MYSWIPLLKTPGKLNHTFPELLWGLVLILRMLLRTSKFSFSVYAWRSDSTEYLFCNSHPSNNCQPFFLVSSFFTIKVVTNVNPCAFKDIEFVGVLNFEIPDNILVFLQFNILLNLFEHFQFSQIFLIRDILSVVWIPELQHTL